MNPTSSPVNVIFLNDSQLKSKEEIIDDHLDVVKTCVTDDDYKALLSLFYEEVAMKIGEMIIVKKIQKNIEILEELRK